MSAEANLPLSHRPKKSGSGNRQQQRVIGVRVTDDYYAKLDTLAQSRNLTVPSYVREYILKAPGVRSRRRPLADVAALSITYTQLNRIGSNLNQIARALNSGDRRELEAVTAMQETVEESMKSIRAALGYTA